MTPPQVLTAQDQTLPLLIAGRYRVLRVLGRGGMGTVLQVEHVRTGERYALKILHRPLAAHRDVVERFRAEVRVPARVDSEHLVRVIDADVAPELDNQPFLVMELLEGCDLKQALESGPFTPQETLWVLAQLARALDRAHQAQVIHRDLKPQNLFLSRRKDGGLLLKVLDFGVAKLMDSQAQTDPGQLLGTPHYMAPEQVRTDGVPIGPGTDQVAFAMLAHRMLSGREYWSMQPVNNIIAILATEGVQHPPSRRGTRLGDAFDAWFLRSCADTPAARWPSVGAQCEELRRLLGVAQLERAEAALQQRVARFAPANPQRPHEDHAPSSAAVPEEEQPGGATHPLQFAKFVMGVCAAAMVLLVGGTLITTQCGRPLPTPAPKDMNAPPPRAQDLGAAPDLKPVSRDPDEPADELEVTFRAVRPAQPRLRCGPKGQLKLWTSYRIGVVTLRPGWECRADQKNYKTQTFSYEALWPRAKDGKVSAKIELDGVVIAPF